MVALWRACTNTGRLFLFGLKELLDNLVRVAIIVSSGEIILDLNSVIPEPDGSDKGSEQFFAVLYAV